MGPTSHPSHLSHASEPEDDEASLRVVEVAVKHVPQEDRAQRQLLTSDGGDANGDELDNPLSTVSQSSRDESSARDISTEDSPSKKDKKKKKGLRTPSFLKKKSKEKKKAATDAA